MRVAVVMPRGCAMSLDRANSMETVARTLAESSRWKGSLKIICDEGTAPVPHLDLLTVPADLGRKARTEAVARAIAAFDPEIIEYHQQLGPAELLARRFPDRINVLHRHTRIKPPTNPLDRYRYRHRLSAFDRLIFVSAAAEREFAADYPSLANRASVVCNPLDMAGWKNPAGPRENLILFSGRAMAEKGLDSFCAALGQVLDERPDWRGALLLGDWDRHADWAAPHVAALARFGDRVEVHASAGMDRVRSVTRRAAIAVTPSRVAEALGLTALEAHAAGAALISSGRGGLTEASGEHALYSDPDDVGGMAEAMKALIDQPKLRLRMARAAQARVETDYAPGLWSGRLDDLRERLVDRTMTIGPGPKPRLGDLMAGLLSRPRETPVAN
ncbi:glycosyltransferase family 4 protein [Brevundimonas subvibrioides]|uniref:Glycosyl transferase group 1 n=1 Tax=Brevundimonas subvibrioides (strain ATCC 15264 / DSM 4735 / LMG 14903 / NBRC 16000 / CB 81) TaxID=633149 RepID=D9QEZ2_BRESC|nr:glycosyltransferase family 4 protein [Brevundimonas subvibrioides]ADL00477.1 glycosyl transferase group 1 [Brevundimonas subvibrioides ATCC 15264]